MSDTDEPQYRQYLRADSEVGTIRDFDENEDGTFSIRMPIASTGEVRNQDDEPLTREEIDGMAQQLADRQIGVFPAHGRDSTLASGRYSPFEKMGYWDDGEVEEREESEDALLIADARLMDPDDLPNVGPMREGLGVLKEQAKRGIAQDASIGWRDDENFPGGVDLMEASIVGIGADWRTNTATETAMARAAVEAGADPEAFIDHLRDAVMGTNGTRWRDLTSQQAEQALSLLERFIESQGEASVRNFDQWLWEIDDDDADDDAIHAAHSALEEFYRANSPMDEPVTESFRDWLEGQRDGNTDDMTDEDSESDEQSADANDGEQTEREDTPEWVQTLLENQNTQTEILQSLADAIREDDDDEDDDDEEEENEGDDDDEDDDEEENSQAADDVAELRDAYERLKEGGVDVSDLDLPDPDDEQDADETDDTTTHDADPDEDATKALLR